ncbi:hypothetical protein FBX98_11848 [Burkholderia sp. SJZ115]|nr:hypothetical protein FBX98_11848 [Burkholderia sp. SJZ115]
MSRIGFDYRDRLGFDKSLKRDLIDSLSLRINTRWRRGDEPYSVPPRIPVQGAVRGAPMPNRSITRVTVWSTSSSIEAGIA